MREELAALGVAARRFLSCHLPIFGDDWWAKGALGALTYGQRRTADERGWTTLEDLDVAALLRVIDANWEVFRQPARLTYDCRTWLKEAMSVRNRMAHEAPGSRREPAQEFRDLDTLARLAQALDADGEQTASLIAARDQAFGASRADAEPPALVAPGVPDASTGLAPGVIVRLRARPDVVGAVTTVWEGGRERRCDVFHDGALHSYFESQVELLASPAGSDLVPADTMRASFTAKLLVHPATRHLYSLNSGRIDYEPYQFRPVMKLISSDRPRLLIADDVGVGKTIEAGLIIKELQARQPLESVLVVCPKQLVTEHKWRSELKRFDEDFVELDSALLRYCLDEARMDGVWPAKYRKAILPYSLLDARLLLGVQDGAKRAPGLLSLNPPVKFDLVVVDEAHHIRKRDTWRHRVVQHLLDSAEAAVLISATPIQTGSSDLFNLLQLLRPDLFTSLDDFDRMREPNSYLARAEAAARRGDAGWSLTALEELRGALTTDWGRAVMSADPLTQATLDLLQIEEPTDQARVRAVRLLQRLNTFSGLLNRTRRRDIGAFTVRNPETIEVDFTPEQAQVYEQLVALCGRILHARQPGMPLEFLLSTLRRQAASSINGLAPFIGDLLARRLDPEQLSEADVDVDLPAPDALKGVEGEIRELAWLAESLQEDPKLDALLAVVLEKQSLPNNKLLVFSTFRHTLSYVLPGIEGTGVRVGLVHGGTPDDERRATRARFALDRGHPDAIDVLLSSEVGTEGLDNQFCDALVNYDIPWNPMRLEQRIGRIDRRGQQSESIAIKNIVVRDTIDASIFHRCIDRIGVFRQSLGGSEEILGELTRDMRAIADDLTLTAAQRDEKLRQLGDNKLARIEEQAELENREAALFGLAIQRLDDEGVLAASSPWMRPQAVGHLVSTYLSNSGMARAGELFNKDTVTLRLSRDVREQLIGEARLVKPSGAADLRWLRKLENTGGEGLAMTVESASAQGQVELLSATHPLVRTAAIRIEERDRGSEVSLRAQSSAVAPGRYPFAAYGWSTLGVVDSYDIRVITSDPSLAEPISELLHTAVDGTATISPAERSELEDRHYVEWAVARDAHVEATSLQVEARLASLELSHRARLAQIREQLVAATHESIRRMKESELRNAEEDFERRSSALRKAIERSDVATELLCVGLLEVLADE